MRTMINVGKYTKLEHSIDERIIISAILRHCCTSVELTVNSCSQYDTQVARVSSEIRIKDDDRFVNLVALLLYVKLLLII